MEGLKQIWNKFVAEHGPKSGAFLQSWEWGKFQEDVGRVASRLIYSNNQWMIIHDNKFQISDFRFQNEIQGVAQIIKMSLPLGKSYLYVPRGPVLVSNFKFKVYDLFEKIKELAKQKEAIFVKVEPPVQKEDFLLSNLQTTDYKLQIESVQPRDTLILDLEKPEEKLLADMHEKTRYNIRLAAKKAVTLRWADEQSLEKDFLEFWRLAEETAKRDKFKYHTRDYYSKMFKNFIFSSVNNFDKNSLRVGLAIAERGGKTLAANIVTLFGNTATYLHGASSHEYRALMAPHLLQWRTIQQAKELGYKYYDFWGIAPISDIRSKWSGFTRFKLGFGGEAVNYAPTFDLPFSKAWYKLYNLAKKFR